jgi:hypothetical protein
MDTHLKKREDVKRLPVGGFGPWKTMLKPKEKGWDTCEENVGFITRTGEGLRLAENKFPKNEGIYEIRVVPPGGDPKVIYLGKAGGEGTGSTLRQRIGQYMNNGSHKADLYNSLLKAGCSFEVRTKNTGSYSTRTRGASDRAKDAETKLLNQFDYAANKMENGKLRLDSVKIKVNGTQTTIEALAKKHGYKSKKQEKDARPGHSSAEKARPSTSSHLDSTTPGLRKDGKPDMRYNANKEKSCVVDSISGKSGKSGKPRLKKDGTPDMRFKANKEKVEALLCKNDLGDTGNAKTTHTSSPLKKDGTPDMRFKTNKHTSNPFVSCSSATGSSSCSSPKISSGPLKRDGTPDMRYKANRQSRYAYGGSRGYSTGYMGSSFSLGYGGGLGIGEIGGGYNTPMTKSGRPDMRFSINKQLYG